MQYSMEFNDKWVYFVKTHNEYEMDSFTSPQASEFVYIILLLIHLLCTRRTESEFAKKKLKFRLLFPVNGFLFLASFFYSKNTHTHEQTRNVKKIHVCSTKRIILASIDLLIKKWWFPIWTRRYVITYAATLNKWHAIHLFVIYILNYWVEMNISFKVHYTVQWNSSREKRTVERMWISVYYFIHAIASSLFCIGRNVQPEWK